MREFISHSFALVLFHTLKVYIFRKQSFLGGIKAFAGNNESVLKWCLNRPYQAKHYRELLNLTGLDPSNDPYKPLHTAEIASSEQNFRNVISDLEAEYLNPFDVGLDKNESILSQFQYTTEERVED